MCGVSVTCCCHTRSSGSGLAVIAVGALALMAAAPVIVAALHAAVDLLTLVIVGLVAAAGVVVIGWIVKNLAAAVIEERSLRRHNERMAQIYPHLRDQIPPRHRATTAAPPHLTTTHRPRAAVPAAPVRIYPTPRAELAPRHGRRAV